MNPHQKNKIDISVSTPSLSMQKVQLTGVLLMQSLSADEQRLFRLYGKLPNKKDLLQNKLKVCTHTLFLYTLRLTNSLPPGTEHPQAENIPHLSASSPPNSASSPSGVSPGSISLGGGGGGVGGDRDSHFIPGAGGHRGSIQGMHGGSVGTLGGQSRSPVKESSYLARTASVDEAEGEGEQGKVGSGGVGSEEMSVSPPAVKDGLPIRR
jgi:hypothetical protein